MWKPDLSGSAPPDAWYAEVTSRAGTFRLTIYNTETAAGFGWRIQDLDEKPPKCLQNGVAGTLEDAELAVVIEAINLGCLWD